MTNLLVQLWPTVLAVAVYAHFDFNPQKKNKIYDDFVGTEHIWKVLVVAMIITPAGIFLIYFARDLNMQSSNLQVACITLSSIHILYCRAILISFRACHVLKLLKKKLTYNFRWWRDTNWNVLEKKQKCKYLKRLFFGLLRGLICSKTIMVDVDRNTYCTFPLPIKWWIMSIPCIQSA